MQVNLFRVEAERQFILRKTASKLPEEVAQALLEVPKLNYRAGVASWMSKLFSIGKPVFKRKKVTMKWITCERVKVDRVACPWLIKHFVDPRAEFSFVPADQVMEIAQREGAIPYDVKGVELGHHGQECSFEAILKKYNLIGDPALVLLAKIVNGADTDNTLWKQPESAGLKAIAEGFRHLGYKDDHELNQAEWIVYDALYAYCQEAVRQGKLEGLVKA
jgi:hypothetical protein